MAIRAFANGLFATISQSIGTQFPANPQTAAQLRTWYRANQGIYNAALDFFGVGPTIATPQNALALVPDDLLAAKGQIQYTGMAGATAQDIINAVAIADTLGKLNTVQTAS